MKKLGFGFMRLPVFDEDDRSTVNIEAVKKMVDCFMERGFTYFDTAHRYNDEASEPAIREVLVKRYPRKSYVLTNKITLNYIKKSEDQKPFLKKQLSTCGVDYFDNYLIHNMGAVSYPTFEKLGTFEFIKQMRDEGYAGHIGFSFHGTTDILEEILQAHPEIEIVQLQINYLDWEDESIQSRKCYETARKYGKQIVVMEPVKGGTLVNLPEDAASILTEAAPQASLASWAIRYAAGLDGVLTVLSGMTTQEQVEGNTQYMRDFQPLTEKEQALLMWTVELIRTNNVIACTSCWYCTMDCPKKITIPDYFNLYNNMKRLKNTSYLSNQTVYYANLIQGHGKGFRLYSMRFMRGKLPPEFACTETLVKNSCGNGMMALVSDAPDFRKNRFYFMEDYKHESITGERKSKQGRLHLHRIKRSRKNTKRKRN